MKRVFLFLFLLSLIAPSFAQTKREWVEYGDAAYKNEDYNTALNFYLKVLDKSTSTDLIRPYAVKPYSPQPKKAKDTSSVKKVVVDPREAYVTHQVAECYRLIRDYKNAEVWYKKSKENNSDQYPYEALWYGEALMKNQIFNLMK